MTKTRFKIVKRSPAVLICIQAECGIISEGILLLSPADLESAIFLWIQSAGDLSTVKLTNKQASAVNAIGREPWGVTSGLLSSTTQSAQHGEGGA